MAFKTKEFGVEALLSREGLFVSGGGGGATPVNILEHGVHLHLQKIISYLNTLHHTLGTFLLPKY